MFRISLPFIAAVGAAVAAMALATPEASAEPPTGGYTGVLIPQDEFPCAEDEVLGYAPEFGPDHVGCIHVEYLGQA